MGHQSMAGYRAHTHIHTHSFTPTGNLAYIQYAYGCVFGRWKQTSKPAENPNAPQGEHAQLHTDSKQRTDPDTLEL